MRRSRCSRAARRAGCARMPEPFRSCGGSPARSSLRSVRGSRWRRIAEDSMIKVSVLYENTPGQKFDMAYYTTRHIPMVKQKLGAACKRAEVDQGLAGVQPGSTPRFIAQA